MTEALCLQFAPETWWPEPGAPGVAKIKQAKRICRACPVRAECLAYGLNEKEGVWGGLTADERLKRRLRKGAAA